MRSAYASWTWETVCTWDEKDYLRGTQALLDSNVFYLRDPQVPCIWECIYLSHMQCVLLEKNVCVASGSTFSSNTLLIVSSPIVRWRKGWLPLLCASVCFARTCASIASKLRPACTSFDICSYSIGMDRLFNFVVLAFCLTVRISALSSRRLGFAHATTLCWFAKIQSLESLYPASAALSFILIPTRRCSLCNYFFSLLCCPKFSKDDTAATITWELDVLLETSVFIFSFVHYWRCRKPPNVCKACWIPLFATIHPGKWWWQQIPSEAEWLIHFLLWRI